MHSINITTITAIIMLWLFIDASSSCSWIAWSTLTNSSINSFTCTVDSKLNASWQSWWNFKILSPFTNQAANFPIIALSRSSAVLYRDLLKLPSPLISKGCNRKIFVICSLTVFLSLLFESPFIVPKFASSFDILNTLLMQILMNETIN